MTEKNSDPKRARKVEAFRDLIGLNEEELNAILQDGRNKYDPQTHQALPFRGYSVIRNIGRQEAEELHLSQSAKDLKGRLKAAGLERVVAFVCSNSFHATTFDLINEADYEEELKIGNKLGKHHYKEIETQVVAATRIFLRDKGTPFLPNPTHRAIRGIDTYAPKVLIFKFEKLDPGIAKEYEEYRQELHDFLTTRIGEGYTDFRSELKRKSLSPHLTVGYVVNRMDDDNEIQKFFEVLDDFNAQYQRVRFELSPGEVTRFHDMDTYIPEPI